MRSRWLTALLCATTVVGIVAFAGCNALSAERNDRRVDSMRTDLDHMVDDADYILGWEQPSQMYDESLPPYHSGVLAR